MLKPALDCCDPWWMAYRPSGAAWVHGRNCATGRTGEKVLDPELEQRISDRRDRPRPKDCAWHYPYEYLVGDVCDGPNCKVYRDVWSDRDDDIRPSVRGGIGDGH